MIYQSHSNEAINIQWLKTQSKFLANATTSFLWSPCGCSCCCHFPAFVFRWLIGAVGISAPEIPVPDGVGAPRVVLQEPPFDPRIQWIHQHGARRGAAAVGQEIYWPRPVSVKPINAGDVRANCRAWGHSHQRWSLKEAACIWLSREKN